MIRIICNCSGIWFMILLVILGGLDMYDGLILLMDLVMFEVFEGIVILIMEWLCLINVLFEEMLVVL